VSPAADNDALLEALSQQRAEEQDESMAARCRQALAALPADAQPLRDLLDDRDLEYWREGLLIRQAIDILLADCHPAQARRRGEEIDPEALARFQRAYFQLDPLINRFFHGEWIEVVRAFEESLWLGEHAAERMESRLERVFAEADLSVPVLCVSHYRNTTHALRSPGRTLCGLQVGPHYAQAWKEAGVSCGLCLRSMGKAMREVLDTEQLYGHCLQSVLQAECPDIKLQEGEEPSAERFRQAYAETQAEEAADFLARAIKRSGSLLSEALLGCKLSTWSELTEVIKRGFLAPPGEELQVMRKLAAEAKTAADR